MDRVAVFVDAGYFFAQGSAAKFGGGVSRAELQLNVPEAVEALKKMAEESSGLSLLRIYWYDGARRGLPSAEQAALAFRDNVKLRLGVVGFDGKQKGVDSLAVTDMITLARNAAMAECVLLSGDDDLRVGVQQAQEFGVRVRLVGIAAENGSTSQSNLLRREADATSEWGVRDVDSLLDRVEGVAREVEQKAENADETLVWAAQHVAEKVESVDVRRIVIQYGESRTRSRAGYVDALWNAELLRTAARAMERSLEDPEETDRIRSAFIDALRARLGRG